MRFSSFVRYVGASLLGLGCAAPLDAPSAYEDEQFLCDPDRTAEWDAFVSACNDLHAIDGSCEGVVSLRGELNAETFLADSPMSSAFLSYDPAKPTSVPEMRFKGQAPYFGFNFSTGALTDETMPGSAPKCVTEGTSLFALEVRGSSSQRGMHFDRCDMAHSAEGLHFVFSARLALGGYVEGCAQFPPTLPPR